MPLLEMLFLFVSALLGTVLCFLIMFMINYKYAALAVGKFFLIYIICILFNMKYQLIWYWTRECQTTRPLDNSPQTTCPARTSDLVVDKGTKNNFYGVNRVKPWFPTFNVSFGSVMDKRTRG